MVRRPNPLKILWYRWHSPFDLHAQHQCEITHSASANATSRSLSRAHFSRVLQLKHVASTAFYMRSVNTTRLQQYEITNVWYRWRTPFDLHAQHQYEITHFASANVTSWSPSRAHFPLVLQLKHVASTTFYMRSVNTKRLRKNILLLLQRINDKLWEHKCRLMELIWIVFETLQIRHTRCQRRYGVVGGALLFSRVIVRLCRDDKPDLSTRVRWHLSGCIANVGEELARRLYEILCDKLEIVPNALHRDTTHFRVK